VTAARAWLILGVLASATVARADDSTLADQKFDEAQKLRDAGKLPESCALFRESLRLNPQAIGTMLNVARCDEEQGKLAAAIRGFSDARDRARELHLDPQRDAAEQHLHTLVERVPHIAFAFVTPPIADTRLTVDDVVIDPANAGDVLVDPGSVHVVVSAPGRVAFETHVAIAEREHHTQAIPMLALPVTIKNPRRLVGKVVTFAGIGVVVIGEAIAIGAKKAWNDNTAGCTLQGGVLTCDSDASNRANTDMHLGNVATGIVIGGLVTAAVGVGLWYFSPNHAEQHVALIPTMAPGEAGLAAVGHF
jgi:hypothetical protein